MAIVLLCPLYTHVRSLIKSVEGLVESKNNNNNNAAYSRLVDPAANPSYPVYMEEQQTMEHGLQRFGSLSPPLGFLPNDIIEP